MSSPRSANSCKNTTFDVLHLWERQKKKKRKENEMRCSFSGHALIISFCSAVVFSGFSGESKCLCVTEIMPHCPPLTEVSRMCSSVKKTPGATFTKASAKRALGCTVLSSFPGRFKQHVLVWVGKIEVASTKNITLLEYFVGYTQVSIFRVLFTFHSIRASVLSTQNGLFFLMHLARTIHKFAIFHHG